MEHKHDKKPANGARFSKYLAERVEAAEKLAAAVGLKVHTLELTHEGIARLHDATSPLAEKFIDQLKDLPDDQAAYLVWSLARSAPTIVRIFIREIGKYYAEENGRCEDDAEPTPEAS